MDIWTGLAFGVAVWLAFKFGQFSILAVLKEDIRNKILNGERTPKLNEVVDLDEDTDETLINVEQHQGQYYAFATTGEFLAQGADFDTMFGVIKQRFPERNFRVEKMQAQLSEEEVGRMVKSIFKTFGDRNEQKS
jgi:hypothetical protein